MVVRNAFAELSQEHTNQYGDAHLVSGNKIKWRREMNDPIATWWDKSESSITIPEPSGGTLVIPMGVVANAESWIVSKEIFTFPLRVSASIQLSQKIANNEVYLEIVGCNAAGVLDETRVAAWRFAGSDSATVTIGRAEVRNGSAARVQSGNLTTVSQTAASQIFEITAEADEVWFSSKAGNSTSARSVAAVYNVVSPDPAGNYKLRVRVKNGATAPASSTNVTVNFVLALDYTEQQVEVTGGNGNTATGQAMPVAVVSGATTGTPSLAGSSTVTGTTASKVLSAASTNLTLVKSTAGRLYGYHLVNTSAAWRYMQLYNKATAPLTTDVPLFVIAIPPGGVAVVDRSVPITFAAGIGYAIVGGPADNDATVVGASEVIGHLLFV